MTRVVNIYRDSHYDLCIMRPSILGNPFVIGILYQRGEAVAAYRKWISEPEQTALREYIKKTCKDKVLGCCCKPLVCHGDVHVEICDGLETDD